MNDRFIATSKVEVSCVIRINESELRALEALTGYNTDAFLKFFYQYMGKHYLEPHEVGLRSFSDSVKAEVPLMLRRADKAREAFIKPKKDPQNE